MFLLNPELETCGGVIEILSPRVFRQVTVDLRKMLCARNKIKTKQIKLK